MKRRRIGHPAGILITLCLAACSPHPSPESSATAQPPLPDPLAAGWRGRPVCELLHEDDTLRALRCTFAPGQGHERHFHAPHFGYALSGGRMRLTDARGSREVELATGSSFASPGLAWHEVENVGPTTVAYLILEPRPPSPH
jgi:quercetin dioxygenase-like cupin family protein